MVLQLWEPQDAMLSWEFRTYLALTEQLSWWPSSKESACNAGGPGSIPGSGGMTDLLEKGMATHSSILVWRIPRMRSLECYSPWDHKELDSTE